MLRFLVGLTALVVLLCSCRSSDAKDRAAADTLRPTAKAPLSLERELSKQVSRLRQLESKGYSAPEPPELEAFRNWFGLTVSAARERRLPRTTPPPGFESAVTDGGAIWLLSEAGLAQHGAGAFALRPDPRVELVVQAPHTFFDRGTLPIALATFRVTGARALLLNTVHRAPGDSRAKRLEAVRSGKSPADLAHQATSFFQAAHEELGRRLSDPIFVQLHGFADEKAPHTQIIVSASGTSMDPKPIAQAFNDRLGPGTAKTYPAEVQVLGGTTNAQAKVCRTEGWRFLHLELARSLRERLEQSDRVRESFANALYAGIVGEAR